MYDNILYIRHTDVCCNNNAEGRKLFWKGSEKSGPLACPRIADAAAACCVFWMPAAGTLANAAVSVVAMACETEETSRVPVPLSAMSLVMLFPLWRHTGQVFSGMPGGSPLQTSFRAQVLPSKRKEERRKGTQAWLTQPPQTLPWTPAEWILQVCV